MTITRTIKVSKFGVKVYDIENDKIIAKVLEVSGDKESNSKEVEKAIKDFDKENKGIYKVMKIIDKEVVSGLYALEESDFLKYATRIGDGR